MNRNEIISTIKAALKRRSGKSWSVTGGRGTAYGWLKIDAPPARRTARQFLPTGMADEPGNYVWIETGEPDGYTTPADRIRLASLLRLASVSSQGISIPASNAYYQEYLDRAEGREPSRIGTPYWD